VGRGSLSILLAVGLAVLGLLALLAAVAGLLWIVQSVLNAEEEA
jgi:hypothetical protein